GDARFRVAMQQSQDELVYQRRFASAARPGETDHLRILDFGFWILDFLPGPFAIRITVLNLGQLPRQLHVGRRAFSATVLMSFPVTLVNPFHHLAQRGAGEENLVDTALLHHPLIVVRDRAAAAAEDLDVIGPALLQLPDYFGKKLDVPAVVTLYSDRAHVLLDGGAHDVLRVTMVAKLDDRDPVPDELDGDGVDRTIVPI